MAKQPTTRESRNALHRRARLPWAGLALVALAMTGPALAQPGKPVNIPDAKIAAPAKTLNTRVPKVLSGLTILQAVGVKDDAGPRPPVRIRQGEALIDRIKQFTTGDYQPSAEPAFTISPRNPVGPHGISMIGRGPISDYYPYTPATTGQIRLRTNLIPDANGNRVESPALMTVMFPYYQAPAGYYLLDFTVHVVDTAGSPNCRWSMSALQAGTTQTVPCTSAPNNAWIEQHLLVAMHVPTPPPGLPNFAYHMQLENQRNDKTSVWRFDAVTITRVQ